MPLAAVRSTFHSSRRRDDLDHVAPSATAHARGARSAPRARRAPSARRAVPAEGVTATPSARSARECGTAWRRRDTSHRVPRANQRRDLGDRVHRATRSRLAEGTTLVRGPSSVRRWSRSGAVGRSRRSEAAPPGAPLLQCTSRRGVHPLRRPRRRARVPPVRARRGSDRSCRREEQAVGVRHADESRDAHARGGSAASHGRAFTRRGAWFACAVENSSWPDTGPLLARRGGVR